MREEKIRDYDIPHLEKSVSFQPLDDRRLDGTLCTLSNNDISTDRMYSLG